MTPADIDRVFGRGRLKMVTGEHVEVFREAALPGERRRYTKRFLSTQEGDFRHWTEREWRILARLVGHRIGPVPDVVRFDRGDGGSPALVQTYDAGVTVDHWATLLPVQRDGRVLRHVFEDCAHWWALAMHSLIALDAIHELQLVHLDLKADNLCIPLGPADFSPDAEGQLLQPLFGQIALIDFAFSLVSGESLSTALPIGHQGEYDYQSPRLLRALEAGRRGDLQPTRQLDWRCDVFSLAAMLSRYLPVHGAGERGDWTEARLAQAQALVGRLFDAHHGALPVRRPHRQWIALAERMLNEPALAASLASGWQLASDAVFAPIETPTPVTRIAMPIGVPPEALAANAPRPATAARGADRLRQLLWASGALALGALSVPLLGEAWLARQGSGEKVAASEPGVRAPSVPQTMVAQAPAQVAAAAPTAAPASEASVASAAAVSEPEPVSAAASSASAAAPATTPALALAQALPASPAPAPATAPAPGPAPRPAPVRKAVRPPVVARAPAPKRFVFRPPTKRFVLPAIPPPPDPAPVVVAQATPVAAPAPAPAPAPPPAPAAAPVSMAATLPAPLPSSSLPRATDDALVPVRLPTDFAERADELLAHHVPRIAQRAERRVLRVLHAASQAEASWQTGAVLDATRALRLPPDEVLAGARLDVADARRLNDAAYAAFWNGHNLPRALSLQLRAFGANPEDPEVAGNLAFYYLKQRPAQPETARQLAMVALTLSDSQVAGGRVEDWTNLAIASALSGRTRDASNAWFVTLALSQNVDRSCRAALAAYAWHGERLREPTEAMLARISAWGRSQESTFCRWPPSWSARVRSP